MTRVLLIHGGSIPHYRVPIYGYLSNYLKRYGFDFMVASDGVQPNNPHAIAFKYEELPLSALRIATLIYREKVDVIILFVDMRNLYLFPLYMIVKIILRRRLVWWGQGRDLADRDAPIKNLAYSTEHWLCDSIILYAEHLKKYVNPLFHKKLFVANNTLVLQNLDFRVEDQERVLLEFGIHTRKNIICVGRLQKRKRLDHLVAAHASMNRPDIGLILVGPDQDGILDSIKGENVFKLGPLYGPKKLALLAAADVYCLPGAVGLSIVDAFHCGLPIVTEEGDESAEIMYLRDRENGFVVPRDNIGMLTERLLVLLDDDVLRRRFSAEAKREIEQNGHIERLCAGFRAALSYATRQAS